MEITSPDEFPQNEDGLTPTSRIESLWRSETHSLRADWSWQRQVLAGIVESGAYQWAVGGVIAIHAFLIIQETDIRASGAEVNGWRHSVNHVLMILYAVDIVLCLYVHQWKFFLTAWNVADLLIVATDVVSQALTLVIGEAPAIAVLRVCRLSRLLRFTKFLRKFRELEIMLLGFLSAMRAIFWATCMILVILTVFSIIAVEILHPVATHLTEQGAWKDCERCQRAFSSVMAANLTFMQQIVAGDSWGAVSVPIIEEEPLAAAFLVTVFVIVQFGVLNLIVTVIVDVANTAREADDLRKLEDRTREFQKVKKKLLKLCEELDEDGSGDLSLQELLNAMDNNPRFAQLMAMMDIRKEDMHIVFKVLDEDHSGSVLYTEFVEQLYKVKSQDTHTTLIFIKGHLNEVRCKVSQQLTCLREEVLAVNVDMANSVRKILLGESLPEGQNPMAVLSEGESANGTSTVASREARTRPADVCGEGGEADIALASTGDIDSCIKQAAVQANPCERNGNACCKDGSFLGLVRFEEALKERLLVLERQVGVELAQLTREMAGRLDEQLAFLQDMGSPVQQAPLDSQEAEPSSEDADAKDAQLSSRDWQSTLWEPSQQGMLFGDLA